jgi:hypothetical protein
MSFLNIVSGNGSVCLKLNHLPVIALNDNFEAESVECFFKFDVHIITNIKTLNNNNNCNSKNDNNFKLDLSFDLLGKNRKEEIKTELFKLDNWFQVIIKSIDINHNNCNKLNIIRIFEFINIIRDNLMSVCETKDPSKIKEFDIVVKYNYSF